MSDFPEFKSFAKIARLSREIVITEKIDGTNGLIYIDEQNNIFAGSRNRWLWGSIQEEIHNDNHGFAAWVKENQKKLLQLGPGYHYGEWAGQGIQRNYGLKEKRFYLFNINKWWDRERNGELKEGATQEYCPSCCYVIPILYKGVFNTEAIENVLNNLKKEGSVAVPGFMKPEGIVIFHKASKQLFKKTILNDEKPKNQNEHS